MVVWVAEYPSQHVFGPPGTLHWLAARLIEFPYEGINLWATMNTIKVFVSKQLAEGDGVWYEICLRG